MVSNTLSLADVHLAPMIAYFISDPGGAALLKAYERLFGWWSAVSQVQRKARDPAVNAVLIAVQFQCHVTIPLGPSESINNLIMTGTAEQLMEIAFWVIGNRQARSSCVGLRKRVVYGVRHAAFVPHPDRTMSSEKAYSTSIVGADQQCVRQNHSKFLRQFRPVTTEMNSPLCNLHLKGKSYL